MEDRSIFKFEKPLNWLLGESSELDGATEVLPPSKLEVVEAMLLLDPLELLLSKLELNDEFEFELWEQPAINMPKTTRE